jgi:hypothetical protein
MTSGPETIQMGAPMPPPAAAPAAAQPTPRERMEVLFWRAIPVAILLAAWLPSVLGALGRIAAEPLAPQAGEVASLAGLIRAYLGEPGLVLVAPVIAAASLAGTWMLARTLGAPLWGAAIAASVAVALHVFGLAPSPVAQPQDAGFAAAMILAAAFTARAVTQERQAPLAWAFVAATIACWLRPWAAWPAAAVLVGVVLVTKVFEERPWCGWVAAMAWGPGFWLAKLFGESGGFNSTFFAAPHAGGGALREGMGSTVTAAQSLPDQLIGILGVLVQALPIVVLAVLAVAGLALCVILGGFRRRAAMAVALFAGITVFGAIGYGDLVAARLLLDPLLLAMAAGAAVAVPVLLSQRQMTRHRTGARQGTAG